MNNLNLKNSSYDEIFKESKINEFDDSIFLDSTLSELIGGKGKSKLAKKMKKAMKKIKESKKGSKKGSKKKKYDSDDDSDDDSDIDLNNILDNEFDLNLDNKLKIKRTYDIDLHIDKIEKKILKLTNKLMEIKAKKEAESIKNKGSVVANKFIDQLKSSQSGGNSDETSDEYYKQKNNLISLPRLLSLSDVTSSEPVAYTQYGSSTSYSSSETPSSSSYESSETPSSSSYESSESSESSSSLLSETPETQGVIGDISRGIKKLYTFLSK